MDVMEVAMMDRMRQIVTSTVDKYKWNLMGFYARIFRGGKAQLLYCAGIEMGLIPTSGGRRNWSHLEPGTIMQQALPFPEY